MCIYRKILSNDIGKFISYDRNSFNLLTINLKFRFIFLFSFFFVLWFFLRLSCLIFYLFPFFFGFCSFFIFFSLSFFLGFINLLLSLDQSFYILIISIQSHFEFRSKTLPRCFKFLQRFFFQLDSIIVLL